MRKTWLAGTLAASIFVMGTAAAAATLAEAPSHPLDALTGAEINESVALLRAAGKVSKTTRFPTVTLLENAKAEVLAWQPGQPFARRAAVTLYDRGRLYEAVVNLSERRVEGVTDVKGRQPGVMFEEFLGAGEMVKADKRWQAAMRKRGYTTFDTIICLPLTVGPAVDDKLAKLRLLNVPCYDREGAENNIYGRPIENVLSTVDVLNKRVVQVVDLGVVPVPSDTPSHRYDPATSTRKPPRPVDIVSQQGDNFTMTGSIVQWDKWQFHLRVDKRVGPILSRITYKDGEEARQVAYQINTSEMFVPYMDSSDGWSYKAYMDISEYGFGALSSPMKKGLDCPVNARFLNVVLSDDKGAPVTLKDVVCIFERNTGDPLWRHYEVFTETLESRPDVELVVRMAPEVGNYDYLIDFVFNQRGEIDVRAGAYGIVATKAAAAKSMAEAIAKEDTAYGTLIAPNLIGVNHDHFLSFRVDMDVDGQKNRLVVDRFARKDLKDNPRRRSLWQIETETVDSEQPIHPGHETAWYRIESESRLNAMANPTSYHFVPSHSDLSMLADDEPLQRRAQFATAPLWISRYKPDELYASGNYPNQNRTVEGLPLFVGDKESVANEDLVLWYTIGFRHQVRAEDWPIMPSMWHGFKLRPFNYFNGNPGLDVPDRTEAPAR